jgi:heat-inducible transcriptional repressor
VGSRTISKNYELGSPATIRNEMQKITEMGYLLQPHTSAGRIPTDKGYRFFVNNLLKRGTDANSKMTAPEWTRRKKEDNLRFAQNMTRQLAQESRALTLNYLENEDVFWKEGWEEVLQEPEFEERDNILNFARLLKSLEEHIEDMEDVAGLNIYIGKENPFPKAKDFTVISTRYHLPGGGKGVISIIGPKRMEYDKNINLINSLMKLLDNF